MKQFLFNQSPSHPSERSFRNAGQGLPSRLPTRFPMHRLIKVGRRGDRTAYRSFLQRAVCELEEYYSDLMEPAALEALLQETLKAIHLKRATCDTNDDDGVRRWLLAIAEYRRQNGNPENVGGKD